MITVANHEGVRLKDRITSHLAHRASHLIVVASVSSHLCRQRIACDLILCRVAAHVTNSCRHPRHHTRRISSHLAPRVKVVNNAAYLILTTLTKGSSQRTSAHSRISVVASPFDEKLLAVVHLPESDVCESLAVLPSCRGKGFGYRSQVPLLGFPGAETLGIGSQPQA